MEGKFIAAPKLKYGAGNASSTTTSTSMTNSDTSTPLTSTTNFQAAPTPGEGMLLLDEGAAAEELAYATGTSGGSLTTPLANRGQEGGSAQAHSAGASVKGVLTVGMWNDLVTALLNVLVQSTGAVDTTKIIVPSGSQTFTGAKTFTTGLLKAVDVTSGSGVSTFPTTSDTLVGRATTDTLSNKRRVARVFTIADTATLTPEIDTYDAFHVTALTQAITIANHSTSTPNNFDQIRIRILDNGTARAISFGTNYVAKGGTALPTTTTLSKNMEMGFEWNSNLSKWNLLALAQEA